MSRTPYASVHDLLAEGMTRFQCRLNGRLIAEAMREFAIFQQDKRRKGEASNATGDVAHTTRRPYVGPERRLPRNSAARQLVEFLSHQIHTQVRGLTSLAARHAEFSRTAARVADPDELGRLLLDYAAKLGTTWWRRWGDRRALGRWLNEEALTDRFRRQRGERELMLMFLLDRFGHVTAHIASQIQRTGDVVELWERLRIDARVRVAFEYNGDRRVRVAAMRCLAKSLEPIPPSTASLLVGQENTSRVHRLATDPTSDVWLQCAAIDVLAKIDAELFPSVTQRRLTRPSAGDDLFVRRHCLQQIVEQTGRFADADSLWDHVLQDPSPAVRQQAAATLWQFPRETAWPRLKQLITQDPVSQVRAAALHGALQVVDRPEHHWPFLQALGQSLKTETDTFCQRVAMHVAVQWLRCWSQRSHDAAARKKVHDVFSGRILRAIVHIQEQSTDVPTRRWAAATQELLWIQLDPVANELHTRLAPRIKSLRRGQSCRIPAQLLDGVDRDTLGRTLAVLTQNDFGIELSRGVGGYRLHKQPRFGFRLWRAWNEFWRPATDKRQAYRHTIGRIPLGAIRSPSRIMGELSATKVPGEPLVMSADGTWRPFLPLVDDFVSALNQNALFPRTTRLYSSEGITEIDVSRNPLRRLSASVRLITRFSEYAELRNWNPSSSQRPEKYLQAMQHTGFRVRFRPHGGRQSDSSVTQFFPALLAVGTPGFLPAVDGLIERYSYYFGSAFENTLTQLVAFTAVALLLFLARHSLSNLRIHLARRRIPLSIGGWGTRGKSGTERLKAALLNGTGHGLVSKTTGCEAMFIHAPPCGDPLEIPLYRPGDKATIWEQSNLLRMTSTMRPSVFLWECMALTPDYVNVLQQQWMHDDLATITNTYPDHEDLQGPSGMDVATTITVFVPRRSHLLTTEQQMFPLVRDRCEQRQTTVQAITWLESGLITDDLLDRFPYREHPDNIALVAAMAEELGCSYDFAIKAMADHLIPDLGVLKTHPIARVQDCSLEFTNGMSANERFGCLGNWKRLGFDRQDPRCDPTVFLSTVVNNRADRVARSRVFASVLVNDLQADRHFLIGGNLKGLQGFIWEAWADYERSVSLRREGAEWDVTYAREMLAQLAVRFRVPSTDEQLQASLEKMLLAAATNLSSSSAPALAAELLRSAELCASRLQALGASERARARVARHLDKLLRAKHELLELSKTIDAARDPVHFEQVEMNLRRVLKEWFARKLVVIENYDATGEEIIQQIVDETPPGFLNRVMGIQNIKGTGLDFVYRFHAWDTCHQACQMLESPDQEARGTALSVLQSLPEYGLLCQARLHEACERLRQTSSAFSASSQIQLEAIQKKLADNMQASEQRLLRQSEQVSKTTRPWLGWTLNMLEQWLEVNDAVRRRQRADQIYRDLQHERIGRQRAIEELRKVNKRQKGGWLASHVLRQGD